MNAETFSSVQIVSCHDAGSKLLQSMGTQMFTRSERHPIEELGIFLASNPLQPSNPSFHNTSLGSSVLVAFMYISTTFVSKQAMDAVIQFGRLFFLRQRMWDACPEITLELAQLLLERHWCS